MKKTVSETQTAYGNDDALPEYDFRGGMRGKHHKAYAQGHTVQIHKTGGTTTVQCFTLEDGAVLLEPDVRAYFPDSEAVNNALRTLIALVARKADSSVKPE
jgi:hypothetical protein